MPRVWMLLALSVTLAIAQLRHSSPAAHLQITANHPARIYLLKNDRPFRLHPVDAILPLKIDLFYRDTLWRRTPNPQTLEVTNNEQSHFFLLTGKADFELPPGDYRIEAYRGLFFTPVAVNFTLKPGESKTLPITLERWAGNTKDWLSGDDHIHLPRTAAENETFLKWLQAEDLSVANFLQLQRQIDAAPQYAFGPAGEARTAGYSIRSGQESRSEYYGHINMLGGSELIRPLSVGSMYANEPAASPFPSLLFQKGRQAKALTGYAHFHGSMPHSTLLMDLALGNIDFLEVFQFGKLWNTEWYELLNAGLRVTGIAGSDFPVPLGRFMPWPKHIPLLGPERTLVKAQPGQSAYTAWAAAVKRGEVVVSNGPFVEITRVNSTITATAIFHQPIETLEIIRNGKVVATARDGKKLTVSVPADAAWFAAHARLKKVEGEPQLQAHTNPLYIGNPPPDAAIRASLAKRWQAELEYYRAANLPFASDNQRRQFFDAGEKALQLLQ
ncbi:MAG: CehA/McbA family metallohydrolase [Acidobacteria bacterium]|nr:CehA/McbA family metallohydrolase [Acidobacteriota bacterium]